MRDRRQGDWSELVAVRDFAGRYWCPWWWLLGKMDPDGGTIELSRKEIYARPYQAAADPLE